jgi:ADP-ribosyl-[dinitrogen reductase] hydrolase
LPTASLSVAGIRTIRPSAISRPEFVRTHLSTHRLHPEIEEVAHGSYQRRSPIGSGYVVRSLEAALWAFHDAVNFREAVLRAVNLGDDADTTGAVCGQFAGAYFGELT